MDLQVAKKAYEEEDYPLVFEKVQEILAHAE